MSNNQREIIVKRDELLKVLPEVIQLLEKE